MNRACLQWNDLGMVDGKGGKPHHHTIAQLTFLPSMQRVCRSNGVNLVLHYLMEDYERMISTELVDASQTIVPTLHACGERMRRLTIMCDDMKERRVPLSSPVRAAGYGHGHLWKKIMGLIDEGNIDAAFQCALESKDDIVLAELMLGSGPVFDVLQPELCYNVFERIIHFLVSVHFLDVAIAYLQQFLQLRMQIPAELCIRFFPALHALSSDRSVDQAVRKQLSELYIAFHPQRLPV